ncbi:MAG: UDPGP type 1 family protein [Phycisphaeraceae bacterium]|nr:UDPGP type 1 family protein [Phycisphaeraceae bacterium]
MTHHAPTVAASGGAPTDLLRRLSAIGQEHVLAFWAELGDSERRSLQHQIDSLDLDGLPRLIEQYVRNKPRADLGSDIQPALCYSADHARGTRPWDRARYADQGRALIAAGKVAAFTVAGGQGSRLGFEGPKGCYPGGAVTDKPLFQCLAEWILAARRRWAHGGPAIPWYIMTSPINHEPTVAFFRQHRFFGLNERDVMFFPQGVMPSLDMATGRVLLDQKHALALNPDGHGGSLRALFTSGAIDDMRRRGVEQISYTQIDNPLVRVIDPAFLGLHAFAPDSSGEMSSKMVTKAHAGEKVGVLCRVNGRTTVIEYSDMPEALNNATNPDGSLRFNAGSIAIHVISVAFVRRLNEGGRFNLPYHRAEKKVPFTDPATGRRVEPASNNAVKLETFVFDALPLAERSIVLETDRTDEFAPIKNASGPDSPETCRRLQTLRAARWLEAAGAGDRVPRTDAGEPDCTIEISPLTAMDAAELQAAGLPGPIARGARVAL